MSHFTLHKLRCIATKIANPAKVANFLGIEVARRLKPERVPFLPSRLEVEPVNTCNLKCPHCQVTHWSKKVRHLDAKRFEAILSQFPRLLSVKLQGMGEPMLNRELLKMISMAERRGISTQIYSNGTIYSDEIADQLLKLKRLHICFSIDGATAATFEGIRVGSKFELVIANIRDLLVKRGKNPFPLITACTVITRKNINELKEIVRLAADMGTDNVGFQTFLSDWGKGSIAACNRPIKIDSGSDQLGEALRQAHAVANEVRLKVNTYRGDYYSRKNKCPWPWTRTFIAANGDVVPCCIIADSDLIKMGNVFEQSFEEIWNSSIYREFRRRIKNHQLHDFCKNCYLD